MSDGPRTYQSDDFLLPIVPLRCTFVAIASSAEIPISPGSLNDRMSTGTRFLNAPGSNECNPSHPTPVRRRR